MKFFTFQTSAIVLGVLTGIVAVYDVLAWVYGGAGATISYVIWVSSRQYPIIAGMLGVLFGHLLWQYAVPLGQKLAARVQRKSP